MSTVPESSPSVIPDADALVKAHADLVYGVCLRITGNAQDAADVSQEVFVAWMQNRGRIRGPLAAWLHATARRRALDWLRRHHRRAAHERAVEQVPDADDAALATAHAEARRHLDDCLAALDARSRTLVIERHVLGLSQDAIAARWCISQSQVSRRIERALTDLRRLLERRGVTLGGAVVISGVTAGSASATAVPDLLADLHAACPADLSAPLLAQAQVAGGATLVGGGALTVWWTTWPALVAGGLVALIAVTVAGGLIWRQVVLASQPADPIGALLARLPEPPPHEPIIPANGAPRYRSIERLIAMLPKDDPAVQERVARMLVERKLIRPERTMEEWGVSHGADQHDDDPRAPQFLGRFLDVRQNAATSVVQPMTIQEKAEFDAYLERIRPIMESLAATKCHLNEVLWLERDYRAGYLRSAETIALRIGVMNNLMNARGMAQAWAVYAIAHRDPESLLSAVDALSHAYSDHPCSLITAMIGVAIGRIRDELYLQLIVTDRLSDAVISRWIAEPANGITQAMAFAWQGEVSCMQIPYIVDLNLDEGQWTWLLPSGGEANACERFATWASLPWIRKDFILTAESCLRLGRTMAGSQESLTMIMDDARRNSGTIGSLSIPDLAESNETIAEARFSHAGCRLMAWIIHRHRQGMSLPDRLDEVVDAVSDGRSLLGGSDQTFGLRYQKLSEHRFRLDIDPASKVPTYAIPERLGDLVKQAQPKPPGKKGLSPLDIGSLAWEADVARLPVRATIPVGEVPGPDAVVSPVVPSAPQ